MGLLFLQLEPHSLRRHCDYSQTDHTLDGEVDPSRQMGKSTTSGHMETEREELDAVKQCKFTRT